MLVSKTRYLFGFLDFYTNRILLYSHIYSKREVLNINRFPLVVFFRKKFSSAEGCAEGLFYRLQLLSHDIIGLTVTQDDKLTVAKNFLH